jgi:protoheme IX farnesyltransferase
MALAVFMAIVAMAVAPSNLDALQVVATVLAIAVGAGAAGTLNMWRDADIDALMSRTAGRPIPCGSISPVEALVFGLVLATIAVGVLAIASNIAAAGLLAFTIFFYVVVYTAWLKRRTPQNIVIGGAAGALPPVIGWTAASGSVGFEPLALFLIIFLWTPPHFWALTTGPDNTNNVLALAFGILIVTAIVTGSIWIMSDLGQMMPGGSTSMHMQH